MGLPRSAQAWIALIVVLGTGTTVLGCLELSTLSHREWAYLVLFAVIVVLTDVFRVRLARFNIAITVSTVIAFGAALAFGMPAAVLAFGSLTADLVLRKPLTKAVFNAATYSVVIWCSAWVWKTLAPPGTVATGSLLESHVVALAWMAAGVVFVVANAAAVITVVALADRSNIITVVRSSMGSIAVQMLTLPTLGVIVAVLYRQEPLSLVIVTLPLLALYYSLRSVEQIRRQTLQTIEQLSDVIDRRDPETDQHSQRVAQYVEMICNEMELPVDFTEITTSAARVHDLGKIAVPDAILFKPGRLTGEEWDVIKQHPDEGADLLGSIAMYNVGIGTIRHHHERWDGKGYPSGLTGESIPLGARIVAIADTFDVMTTTRVYRRAVHATTALDEIRSQAGKQFDPDIVSAFLNAMEHEAADPSVESLRTAALRTRG